MEKNNSFALLDVDKAIIGAYDTVITARMFYDPENMRIHG